MNISELQPAIDMLNNIARKKLPVEGWTLICTAWEDSTFQLEYRHAADDGIHHFLFYSKDQRICYRVTDKVDNCLDPLSGRIIYSEDIPK